MSAADVRGRKDLACTADASAFQKAFGAELREQVVERGEPFAVAQADTPHEIFHAMDIPVVSNQWWSAYISAKRLSGKYFGVLDELGYPPNRCSYCSLGLACSLANDPASAPWGGLPKPTVLVARLTCDCIQQVFSQWADVLGTEFFPMEAPAWPESLPEWFRHSRSRWDEVYGRGRIDLHAREIRELIALLERKTSRRFDPVKFEALMERINEQEQYLDEAAEIIATARPCPVSIVDQMPNTMIPQWHRGSEWAVAHARRFRDEARARAQAGIGIASQEKIRLMWIGAGIWHDTSFYQALEERLGAVFVWSMYLPFAGAQYIRELKGRPLEALASRICSMNEVLHLPPWMNEWMVSEARRSGIDAAVLLSPKDNRLSQSGTQLTAAALRASGVPVLMLDADMVNATQWNREAAVDQVAGFLAAEVKR
ncbi:MAG: 2-hydroxyacyl-CoA dehydratase [Proteobacteria bacterium]|jgi:benzoyl-CoA reductase subunit B|nr:2-hydroxyacyl-CoA dehydratase [Pseudomonadota bacterium]MBK7115360.1 2-hydroxyacyl-CoA dehydratase [Pseudomonadota bacterium]MBK9253625.1 2-hydroxyacyl-CoA dehydratase [Pseudomonadota bacterium]